jgi:Zn-dependent protease with chaperone function
MNFFEHQDLARKRTRKLVVFFVLGVLGMILALHATLATLLAFREIKGENPNVDWSTLSNPVIAGIATAIALTIIAIGSLTKIAELRGGGRVVAERLGGRIIMPSSRDVNERRILNIVEEMAIASGVPTPPVYLLTEEQSINAFAAGFAPESAVVAVSRGCVERLSRDELQGVVAHEFSHILNGDMRLNIRLIGMVHGLIAIGLTGWFLLRIMLYTGHSRSRSSDSKGDPRIFLLVLGAVMIVIGFVGSFFGELIKAAVSRQREFLADASAVQFTRNPEGIGGALKKIGGLSLGGRIESPAAPEMRHMFFTSAISSGLAGMLASHPPLPNRIRAIEPNWDGEFLASSPSRQDDRNAEKETHLDRMEKFGRIFTATGATAMLSETTPADVNAAHALINEIPRAMLDASRDPSSARAVIFAILLDPTPGPARDKQVESLRANAPKDVLLPLSKLVPLAQQLHRRLLLPIIDLSMASLAELSPEQYEAFRAQVGSMVYADDQVDLLEWILQRVLLHSLDLRFGLAKPHPVGRLRMRLINKDTSLALSMLAHAGRDDTGGARHAFQQAAQGVNNVALTFLPPTECGLTQLDRALQRLAKLTPRDKQDFIEACAVCIHADRKVTEHEAELFRALGVSLGLPVPPITPG